MTKRGRSGADAAGADLHVHTTDSDGETSTLKSSRDLARRRADWAQEAGLFPIAGTDFHAPDRARSWVGAITKPRVQFERPREACA
jgi:predicted metal-dependent phosphoesterase TrpH